MILERLYDLLIEIDHVHDAQPNPEEDPEAWQAWYVCEVCFGSRVLTQNNLQGHQDDDAHRAAVGGPAHPRISRDKVRPSLFVICPP